MSLSRAQLVKKRAGVKSAITKLLTKAKNTPDSDTDKLRLFIDDLDSKMNTICDLSDKIEIISDENEMEDEVGTSLDYIQNLKEDIFDLTKKLNPSSPSQPVTTTSSVQPNLKMSTTASLQTSTVTTSSTSGSGGLPATSTTAASSSSSGGLSATSTTGGAATATNPGVSTPLNFFSLPPASVALSGLSQFDPLASSFIPTSSTAQSTSFNIRLPRVELATFDGTPTKWQNFWDMFSSSIHLNEKVPIIEKFTRLRQLLENEAKLCITGFAQTEANYQRAVQLLYERYGQPHVIIQAHNQALLNLMQPFDDLTSLQDFYDNLEAHIRGLEALGQTSETYGPLLATFIFDKLPPTTRQNMTRTNGGSDWTLNSIRSALKREIEIIRAGTPLNVITSAHSNVAQSYQPQQRGRSFPSNNNNRNPRTRVINNRNPGTRDCVFCSGEHPPWQCQIKDVTRRNQIVQQKGLCFNCLGQHKVIDCRSSFRCRKCNRKHHSTLCSSSTGNNGNDPRSNPPTDAVTNTAPTEDEPAAAGTYIADISEVSFDKRQEPSSNENNEATTTPDENREPTTSVLSVPTNIQGVLLSTAIAKVKVDGETCEAKILFDLGAQRSFVSEEFMSKFSQRTTKQFESIMLSGIESNKPSYKRLQKVALQVETRDGSGIDILPLVLKTISAPLNVKNQLVKKLPYLSDLQLAHPVTNYGKFEIDILIAADFYWDFVQDEQIRGDGPVAIKSKVGYLLSGPLKQLSTNNQTPKVPEVHAAMTIVDEVENEQPKVYALQEDTEDDLYNFQQFWELESIGIKDSNLKESSDDEYRRHYQENCLTQTSDKQYQGELTWTDESPELPTNYELTDRYTRSMIGRMNPETIRLYDAVIKEQERREFIELVNTDLLAEYRVHYIPHRGVYKPSSTTPLRIVYNCSAKTKNGVSLNDCLRSTPPVYNDIPIIFCHFRKGKHGVISDIEKAFLYCKLHPKDRDATRFLWLSNPEDPNSAWTTYRFKSVLFGATCSPFILDAVIRKHLDLSKDPIAPKILDGLYVDNVVNSFDDDSEIEDYFLISRSLMSTAGFNLRSWRSTSASLNELASKNEVLDQNTCPKVLGMLWDTTTDELGYPPYQKTDPDVITKREVLSAVSKIYDPLGLLSPVVVRAKIFLQKLWQVDGLSWDSVLPDKLTEEWQ